MVVTPEFYEVTKGGTATFYCLNDPATWTFENRRLPSNAVIKGEKLVIRNIQRYNLGIYYCSGYDRSIRYGIGMGKLLRAGIININIM